MPFNWGPNFIVPSEALKSYSGMVLLREEYDEELLEKELEELGIEGVVDKVTNPWYYRKKNTDTWIKIGESRNRAQNFPVSWDTSGLKNGKYEVLGLMHVFVRGGNKEYAIARQNIVEVTVKN
jgi:ATP-dependent DNA ligase